MCIEFTGLYGKVNSSKLKLLAICCINFRVNGPEKHAVLIN